MRPTSISFCLLLSFVRAATRTDPPDGSIIVRADTSTSGEYATLSEAVASLEDGADASIFIYPGTYSEQVMIERSGSLSIYGYTEDTTTYASNQVTITAGIDAGTAGSNDASGTLRVHQDDFKLYNVDVVNSYGEGSQALALSQYGSRTGFYGVSLYGYQDTLLVNQGSTAFFNGYIEGATDFIFGGGTAYFQNNLINVVGTGWITASGRETDDDTMYVFESTTITGSGGSGETYLGRPWRDHARVIFKNTALSSYELNPALWSVWHDDDPNTESVYYADYNTDGSYDRPDFSVELDESTAATYDIAAALGSDYADWVDADYL